MRKIDGYRECRIYSTRSFISCLPFPRNETLERSLVTPNTTVELSRVSFKGEHERLTSFTDKRLDERNAYNVFASKIDLAEAYNQRRGVGP